MLKDMLLFALYLTLVMAGAGLIGFAAKENLSVALAAAGGAASFNLSVAVVYYYLRSNQEN